MMIELILTVVLILLAIPVSVLLLQVLCAMIFKNLVLLRSEHRPIVTVLIPAHNEQSMISNTVQRIVEQLNPGDRLVVVADNCTDATAEKAKSSGAEVLERFDATQRGKGYALDFGVKHCAANPPDVLIIVDADCELSPNAIDVLSRQCVAADRPIQAAYYMRAPQPATLKQKIAEFAWVVKNIVRPSGYGALGLPCQLMGTGMAFPWSAIQDAKLASGEIVEDMKLGLDLAVVGQSPLFSPTVKVTSDFPQDQVGSTSQRTRWEHGHLGMIMQAPRLLLRAVQSGNVGLMAMVFDIIVPPLALLVMLCMSMLILAVGGYIWLKQATVLIFAITLVLLLTLSVLLTWYGFGRDILSFKDLIYAPWYAMSKIPLYLKFIIKRQTSWVRTKREHD